MPEDKSRRQESKKVKPMYAGSSFLGSAAPHRAYPPGYTVDQALKLNGTRVDRERLQVEKEQLGEAQPLRLAIEERNRHDDHAELKSWIQLAIGAAERRSHTTVTAVPVQPVAEDPFATVDLRTRSIAEYVKAWACTRRVAAKKFGVTYPDLNKWKLYRGDKFAKGPSVKTANIESRILKRPL